jgi:hypothetical protein
VYISIHTYSHEHSNITISSNIQYKTTCFDPVCRPSSGCSKNLLSDYTVCVVLLEGDKILSYIINCGISKSCQNYHTYCVVNKFFGQPDDGLCTGPKHVVVRYILLLIVILLIFMTVYVYIDIHTLQLCVIDLTQLG